MRALLFACFWGIALLACGQAIGPRIQFEQPVYDFGELIQGGNVTYSFRFENVGDTPLTIQAAKTACGCDYADYPNSPVLPGAMGEIRYHYDSNRIGEFQKSITVASNDSTQPITRLTIIGKITPKGVLSFEKECVEHLLIPQGSMAPIAFPYRRLGPDAPSLVSQFQSVEVLSVIWKGVESAPELDTVFVWFDTQTLGPFSNSLTLKIESPKEPDPFTNIYGGSRAEALAPFIYLHFEGEIVGPEVSAGAGKRH